MAEPIALENMNINIKRIIHVTREFGRIAGAGGIKDVCEGLCIASAKKGIETIVFLPFYYQIKKRPDFERDLGQEFQLEMMAHLKIPLNLGPGQWNEEEVSILKHEYQPNLFIYFVASNRYEFLFEGDSIRREGIYQYTQNEANALGRPEIAGKGYFDFFAMNVLLVKSALKAIQHLNLNPNVIHCHDGHTALLPVIAQASYESLSEMTNLIPTVLTVHNAGIGYHQEVADIDFASSICGIDKKIAGYCILENRFDPLLAGGTFADIVNTVSENYARELSYTADDAKTDWLGHALLGRGIKLHGITNGVHPKRYDSKNSTDLGIAHSYSIIDEDFYGKEVCKLAFLNQLMRNEIPQDIKVYGQLIADREKPLYTFISRIEYQKGFDALIDALWILLDEEKDIRIVGLGDGDSWLINRLQELIQAYPGKICLLNGYHLLLANQIFAAGDFFIIPSYFEPCGQTDFFAQLMGNIPIVHQVGGLVKIIDQKFGFTYVGGKNGLIKVIKDTIALYFEPKQKTLRSIQISAIKNIYDNFTWDKVLLKKYLPLYLKAINKKKPQLPY